MAESPKIAIPDHELLCPIGRGSYGEVWLARSATGAFRAVKVVFRSAFDQDRPYEREFAGLKRFEPVSRASDTQVDILHVGRNDDAGFFYYVMELADDANAGGQIDPATYVPRTLRHELSDRGRLPAAECLAIGLDLAAALENLHQNGLVHRDIKPSNVVFIQGRPRLADFGLVTSLDSSRSFVGTEGYISPEGPGTPQADIYGLGKILYEICTGRDRLDFPELPGDLKDHPEAKALVQLNEIILKACEDDPKQRYQTAAALREDLLMLEAGKTLVRRGSIWQWTPTPRRFLLLAAGLGLGVLAMASIFLRPHGPASGANRSARSWELNLIPGNLKPGQLAGQSGWVALGFDAKEAITVSLSNHAANVVIAGKALPYRVLDREYKLDYRRLLDIPTTNGDPHHISVNADVRLQLDPDAIHLKYLFTTLGLGLTDGEVGMEFATCPNGWVWSQTSSPRHTRDVTAADTYMTNGFYHLEMDCDLVKHAATYSIGGTVFSTFPINPEGKAAGAFIYFVMTASGPNKMSIVFSNLTVRAEFEEKR